MYKRRILGRAGAGKTTRLISEVDRLLQSGYSAEEIAYVSFTKAAASEAKHRLNREMPYVGTIHSLCFTSLGLQPSLVMDDKDFEEVGREMGIDLSKHLGEQTRGSHLLSMIEYAEAKNMPLKAAYNERAQDVRWEELKALAEAIDRFKAKCNKITFSDMLKLFCRRGKPLPIRAMIVDEAQDLSPLQWQTVELMAQDVEVLIVAGDDLQALYEFAGAEPKRFIEFPGHHEVLPVSYRLPAKVFRLSERVADRIQLKSEEDWTSRAEEGTVSWLSRPGNIDLSHGEWLLLARNHMLLKQYVDECRDQGVLYEYQGTRSVPLKHAWAIDDYLKLQRGEEVRNPKALASLLGKPEVSIATASTWNVDNEPWWTRLQLCPDTLRYYRRVSETTDLTSDPNVRIMSFHASKGREADNVVVCSDMTTRCYDTLVSRNSDAEHRAFYVGVTRAKQNLLIQRPQSIRSYGW